MARSTTSPARPRTSSPRWARVSAPRLPDAPAARDGSPDVCHARAAGRRGWTVSGGDESRPAVDAEGATLPPRHRVLGTVALRGPQARVHHAPALRTMARPRVAPPVVHVLAGGTRALPHHPDETSPRASRWRREPASTPVVSHRFSKL